MRLVLTLVCLLGSLLGLDSVQSYKLSKDWLELQNNFNEDMYTNTGTKSMQFIDLVYPSAKVSSKIGQVGGIDTMPNGNLLVFHRGDRVWTYDSFNSNNDFNTKTYGSIPQPTIVLIDSTGGSFVKRGSWGENKFYMPHGLTVDHTGKVWVTDVALHQVLKFDLNNLETPEITLGVAFSHGNDETHFCKPTDVAVAESNGHVFVADGYCNSRVVEFDESGKFVKQFEDKKRQMQVVHSVTLVEPLNLVCAASRQQGRIACYDITTGDKFNDITSKGMNTVYAVKYDKINKVLQAATGDNGSDDGYGFTFDASEENFGKLLQKWSADDRDLKPVHDLAISPDGSRVYLGQLDSEVDLLAYE